MIFDDLQRWKYLGSLSGKPKISTDYAYRGSELLLSWLIHTSCTLFVSEKKKVLGDNAISKSLRDKLRGEFTKQMEVSYLGTRTLEQAVGEWAGGGTAREENQLLLSLRPINIYHTSDSNV